ncbi:MAG: 4-(cytidine 5'-diphospho)-2-C-methyl-D-erythritol kinase [Opitutaceae bacterium]|nr:4-(cytidine 5'-diphospho)-2-C-methyl-D-erythritol kinase [Opitutaceae bacterium]
MPVSPISIFAPAKLNLSLAITGRRPDGFHDLVSVVAPLDFGDVLHVEAADGLKLTCDTPGVPTDGSNLVLKAATTFFQATAGAGAVRGAKFRLEKKIPVGAGLGGGSSDAVAALRGLNALAGHLLSLARLTEMAARLGSDCPLFLHERPVVMRGRGERIEPLAESAVARLRGRCVLVFKPGFGIPTPWAYAQLAVAAPHSYMPAAEAEARLASWLTNTNAPAEELLFNNMEPPAFRKYVALPALLDQLKTDFGFAARMSGSGSACFGFLPPGVSSASIIAAIHAAWGDSAFAMDTRLM